jgi:hypothetical protein
VDPAAAAPSPEAVVYSAHQTKGRYTWAALERIWSTGFTAAAARRRANAERPLVFVARGTHAAYPDACRGRCTKRFPPHREEPHDGGLPWPGEREADCVALCVTALPTTAQGSKPARWNAYNGRWGTTRCELWVFCSSSDPPKSPGQQPRYQQPWCATLAVSLAANGRSVVRDRAYRRPRGCR